MGLFDAFKKKPVVEPVVETPVKKPRKPRAKKEVAPVVETKAKAKKKTKKPELIVNPDKEAATAKGEPWVSVLSVELDPDNIGNGAFELDWNDKFITNLVRAGYKGKTDSDMVDQWFADVCKNVIAENYEQWEANQPFEARPRVIDRRDIGDGRTEVS